MRLEIRTVGRKTPLDGKLEISASAANHLHSLGGVIGIEIHGAVSRGASSRGVATVSGMACTCRKSSMTGTHVHHFLESELFRALPVNAVLALDLDNAGILSLSPADGG